MTLLETLEAGARMLAWVALAPLLGADAFETRQAASAWLARNPLAAAATCPALRTHPDPEVAYRAAAADPDVPECAYAALADGFVRAARLRPVTPAEAAWWLRHSPARLNAALVRAGALGPDERRLYCPLGGESTEWFETVAGIMSTLADLLGNDGRLGA